MCQAFRRMRYYSYQNYGTKFNVETVCAIVLLKEG